MVSEATDGIVHLFTSLYNFLLNGVFEFLLYVVIDAAVKASLKDCRDNTEKRDVWLRESVFLLFFSVLIYYIHHTPYLLIIFVSTTILYTQLLGRIDFYYWWNKIMVQWDDFEQHKESMEIYEEMKSWHDKVVSMSQQMPSSGRAQQVDSRNMVGAKSGASIPAVSRYTPDMNRHGLARAPLHSSISTPSFMRTDDSGTYSYFKTKLQSVLGINQVCSHPPGLQNGGQNLCFFNVAMQCVSHMAHLLECLLQDRQSLTCSSNEAAFVLSVVELMQGLTVPPELNTNPMLSHAALREMASELPGSMLARPGRMQQQQDTAEFLMWFLQTMHSGLNQSGQGPGKVQRYQSVTTDMIRMKYNITSQEKLNSLKQQCLTEIGKAYGLDHHSFAEPGHKLAELEWLQYKDNNSSAIDELFTGQLAEAQMCLSCSRVSLNCQSFTILPVPISDAQEVSGLTYLEHCLERFAQQEALAGMEGLQCPCSNPGVPVPETCSSTAVQVSPINNGPAKLSDLHKKRLGMKVPSHDLSDDSGFHDHNFKTSTPVHTDNKQTSAISPPKKRLTEGLRRCMLSQLPDCLIIQLMRFSYQEGETIKIRSPVNIPSVGLELTHLLMSNVLSRSLPPPNTDYPSNYRYNLAALCVHLGEASTSSGHYIAYCKSRDGQWYKFDDEHVTQVNIEYELAARVVRENAYLLFYRRASL